MFFLELGALLMPLNRYGITQNIFFYIDKSKRVRYTMGMEIIKQYMAKIGRRGGSMRSERKTHACRENGKKGGRPKVQQKRVPPKIPYSK